MLGVGSRGRGRRIVRDRGCRVDIGVGVGVMIGVFLPQLARLLRFGGRVFFGIGTNPYNCSGLKRTPAQLVDVISQLVTAPVSTFPLRNHPYNCS